MNKLFKLYTTILAIIWVIMGTGSLSMAAVETYIFKDEVKRTRYQQLVTELRCPKCQNQNLADSDSPISADLRREIYFMLQENKGDAEIVDYMVTRYGEFVLYRPPLKASTWILWFGPLVFLAIGFVVILLRVKKRG